MFKLFKLPTKKQLHIAILSRGPKLYSTQRLVEAAEKAGHTVQVVDVLRCYMNVQTEEPGIYYKGEKLPVFDAVIPRISPPRTFYGTAILRQMEMMGVYAINGSLAITRSRDKLRSLQLFTRKGVGVPKTWFAHSPRDLKHIFEEVGDKKLVAKLLEGTQGKGVLLLDNKETAPGTIEAFMGLNANLLVQEFVEEAEGADIRCLVVGGKVVAAMKRQAQKGEFRSNLHLGGTAEVVKISKQEQETAIHAADVMGLNLAGVDILRSKNGPVVIEVNSSPGLEGIEKATEIDVAGDIIKFIEKNVAGGITTPLPSAATGKNGRKISA
jgi:ribosomal protein S6--L-glutamate ligase